MRSCYNPENFKPRFTSKQYEEVPVAFETVRIPANVGDSKTYPPTQGAYENSIVQYEADETVWLYDSFGNYTKLTTNDLTAMVDSVNGKTGRVLLKTADLENNSGYITLSDIPTIGSGTLTVQRNAQDIGTFNANDTTDKSINISVPTTTSELDNDSGFVSADVSFSGTSTNAIQNATVTGALDRDVVTDVQVNATQSTTTVQLDSTKTNLKTGESVMDNIPLPVASTSQAGVMNKATYDTIVQNSNNIEALLNGAVAVTGLPSSPTQSEVTAAWQNETGLTTLINRASVYDVDNSKVWTYYTNDNTWHEASNTTQVTVNTFTNSSEGVIKGSTTDGQVYAESDGTGSVNGWDTLSGQVANNTSKLGTIAQGAEVNVQSNWNETNTASDAYIQNKPTIPTVNNGTLTIQRNGTDVATFTANSSTNATANISVPTVNNGTLTIQKNGSNVATFTANSASNVTANISVPTITLSTTDIGEGATLAANTLYGVYS